METEPVVVLDQMSYQELLAYKDQLLLELETQPSARIRMSEGRIANLVLGIGVTLICFLVFAKLWEGHDTRHEGNPLLILGVLACLFVGAVISERIWRALGFHGRTWSRRAIHYWPVTLSVLMLVASLFKISRP